MEVFLSDSLSINTEFTKKVRSDLIERITHSKFSTSLQTMVHVLQSGFIGRSVSGFFLATCQTQIKVRTALLCLSSFILNFLWYKLINLNHTIGENIDI